MLGYSQVGRRRHNWPRRGCRIWRGREIGQCAGLDGERLGGSQSLGSWSPDFRGATFPGQGMWSPKALAGGRAQAPPRASVTRLLLRTLGAPLHPESPRPFVLAGNRPSKMGMGRMSRCGTQSSALDDCRPGWLWVLSRNSLICSSQPPSRKLYYHCFLTHPGSMAVCHVPWVMWGGSDGQDAMPARLPAASPRVHLLGCPK